MTPYVHASSSACLGGVLHPFHHPLGLLPLRKHGWAAIPNQHLTNTPPTPHQKTPPPNKNKVDGLKSDKVVQKAASQELKQLMSQDAQQQLALKQMNRNKVGSCRDSGMAGSWALCMGPPAARSRRRE